MSFADALRATEVLLGWAVFLSCLEHVSLHQRHRAVFLLRAGFALCLLFGIVTPWAALGLLISGLVTLWLFHGPYNGGSDKMITLVTWCLTAALWLPAGPPQQLAIGYLAVQLVLSYAVSGQVKLCNRDWRSGTALGQVFSFSAYPISAEIRRLSRYPTLLRAASWSVIVFELLFPLALLHSSALVVALVVGAMFHLANAVLFGLNRFVWAWLAAYPSVIWFQTLLPPLPILR